VGRPVHLVLHRGEEPLRCLGVGLVVDAGGIDVEHLLVELPLRGPDGAGPLEQLVEVVGLARARRVHEPLVVHGEAFDQILVEALDRPLSELGAPMTTAAAIDRVVHHATILEFTGNSVRSEEAKRRNTAQAKTPPKKTAAKK